MTNLLVFIIGALLGGSVSFAAFALLSVGDIDI